MKITLSQPTTKIYILPHRGNYSTKSWNQILEMASNQLKFQFISQ